MKKLIFIFSLSALILVGCEEKFKSKIWINPNIEYCGVTAPIDSLEWFKNDFQPAFDDLNNNYEYCYEYYSEYIYLYRNNETQEDFVVTCRYLEEPNWYGITLYRCDGTIINHGYFSTNNNDFDRPKRTPNKNLSSRLLCDSCDTFFKTHTLIDTIAYWKINPNLETLKELKK